MACVMLTFRFTIPNLPEKSKLCIMYAQSTYKKLTLIQLNTITKNAELNMSIYLGVSTNSKFIVIQLLSNELFQRLLPFKFY